MLKQNEVYEWQGSKWRLIYMDDNGSYLYPLGSNKAKYQIVAEKKIEQLTDKGELKPVEDPYESISGNVMQSERGRKRWEIINQLVGDPAILYNKTARAEKIREIQENQEVSKKQVYKLLALWWEKGQCQEALNPGYGKSTGRRNGTAKIGRTSCQTHAPAVNDEMRSEFERSFKKYLFKENHCTVKEAYRLFLVDYVKSHPGVQAEQYPTFWQYRYHLRKYHSPNEIRQKQSSKGKWEKDQRPLKGSVYDIVDAPGKRYEIDSTLADVTLVSETDRSAIVGRPTLYAVTDVYTGMVVGVSVTLDDPQFKCAGDALFNAFTDKMEQCRELDIPVDKDDWPAIGIPVCIVADNAELKGEAIENFLSSYGCWIDYTAPYRADQKGTVESSLGLIQAAIRDLIPGVPEKKTSKKAGFIDRRLEAALTLKDYRRLVLIAALKANNRIREKTPEDFPASMGPTPLKIWQWSAKRGTVLLRPFSNMNRLRLALLPTVQCTISKNGILADGIRYWCATAREKGFFDRDMEEKRPKPGKLAFDPANISKAWYYPEPNTKPEVCWECMLAPESARLKGLSKTEAMKCIALVKKTLSKTRTETLEKNTTLTMLAQEIVQDALKKKPETEEAASKRLKKIKANRQKEKNAQEKENPRMKTTETKNPIPNKEPAKPKHKGVELSCVGYPLLAKDIPD